MNHSRAQIVATIGPASKEKKILKDMFKHQMDVARLNFAWGTYAEHAHYIKTIREIAKELGRQIPIIQDLPGPRRQTEGGHKFNKDSIGPLTEKDLKHLKFGLAQKVEYISLSYVGSAADLKRLKEEINQREGGAKIIAKIERKEALQNLDEVLAVSDALMIGRGDLGNEIPLEQIPFVQKEIIEKAKAAKRPVIVATQMLLSMTENPTPTRAEVTDVNKAIMDGADAVMLSEETATGKYPVEAVRVMEQIVLEAEKHEQSLQINPL